MKLLWSLTKYAASFLMLIGLVFSSGVFSVLVYGKITGKEWAVSYQSSPGLGSVSEPAIHREEPDQLPQPEPTPAPFVKPPSVILEAPVFLQFPELRSGCELTSLSMLLHYAGIPRTKMELLPEMKRDLTPLQRGKDGEIVFWGNPNDGFVGDITGKSRGFGIFHGALFELLEKYIPHAVDLTRGSFEQVEEQIARGIPVVVWTTVNFQVPLPDQWVVWDTPTGPIRTTFKEHAVLMVGYDDKNVYVNDPWTGKANVKVPKERFIQTWEVMGSQALSYKAD